jgi:hypothetical protein
VSPAVIAAVAAILEYAAKLLKDHGDGKITEADILAKVAAFTADSATMDAAADAAAEAAADAKWPEQKP